MLRSWCAILFLSSCATAPLDKTWGDDFVTTTEDPLAGSATPVRLGPDRASPPAPSTHFMPLRLGVEYLPPRTIATGTDSLLNSTPITARGRRQHSRRRRSELHQGAANGSDGVVVSSLLPAHSRRAASKPGANGPEDREDRSIWALQGDELERIEDSAERLTVQFVNDLVGEDRRRMRRELGTPILMTRRLAPNVDGLIVPFDQHVRDDEERFLNRVGPRLLRRPLRNLLKKATFIDDVEVALNAFKADHVPLSGAYHERSGHRRRQWGRVSMRLRLSDGSDPVELTYYNWNCRFSSSKERGRLLYRFRLGDGIDGHLRYRFDYISHDTSIRGDLRYEFDPDTHLYMLFGDRLDFLAGPTAYSLLNSPLDGTPGVLFYVEHLF